jgi:histidinol-phosphate/aromatic aminotransferase/cobyric acid decarboxylase-like protein
MFRGFTVRPFADNVFDVQRILCSMFDGFCSGTANFLLCKLVGTDMTAKTFIAKCQEKSLFLRDVSSMGSRFDPYTFRISVKDISTNKRMAVIMSEVLQEL